MKPREIDIHIDRIALTAMPVGGERRLREAVARAAERSVSTTVPAPAGADHTGGADELGNSIASRIHLAMPGLERS